jgi:very-short-patch-repair endonuclease
MKMPNFNLPNTTKRLYCNEHKKDKMINVCHKLCISANCSIRPNFNIPSETTPIYCAKHKLDGMIDTSHKKCNDKDCTIKPKYNLPTENKGLYCNIHKLDNMINIYDKKCQYSKCKETPMFGLHKDKRPKFCNKHKLSNMINLVLEKKCSVLECNEEYNNITNEIKYCIKHCPDKAGEINVKRLCKFCDIKEESKFVCKDCKKIQNKKEWAIVRHLRKAICNKFDYNSSKMLEGCSKKRPDIYFELDKHSVIVEVDENQHNKYENSCECARINEIVNGIGGKSVIIIRYNPDVVRNKNKVLTIKQCDRIELLVKTIKEELTKEYDEFIVKIIQLYYNDDYEEYKNVKEENITDLVCV